MLNVSTSCTLNSCGARSSIWSEQRTHKTLGVKQCARGCLPRSPITETPVLSAVIVP